MKRTNPLHSAKIYGHSGGILMHDVRCQTKKEEDKGFLCSLEEASNAFVATRCEEDSRNERAYRMALALSEKVASQDI